MSEEKEKLLNSLRIGDLVEFHGRTEIHWGVYLGNENIIHLTSTVVKTENFWKVADGCKAGKNNSKDNFWQPRPSHNIVTDAHALVGSSQGDRWMNSEEFVIYLRYGEETRSQIDRQSCHFASSNRYRQDNSNVLNELQIGDIVEFDRQLFKHCGVYVGQDYVVHLTGVGNGWCSGVQVMGIGVVKKENFWEVANGGKAKKNNKDNDKRLPRPSYLIGREARALVGTVKYMNALTYNCEHFASEQRYGTGSSIQSKRGVVAISGVALALGLVPSAVIAGGVLFTVWRSRYKNNTHQN